MNKLLSDLGKRKSYNSRYPRLMTIDYPSGRVKFLTIATRSIDLKDDETVEFMMNYNRGEFVVRKQVITDDCHRIERKGEVLQFTCDWLADTIANSLKLEKKGKQYFKLLPTDKEFQFLLTPWKRK